MNDLKRATAHLQGFQSRAPRKLEDYDLPWPEEVLPLGYVESTLYRSDKDDPLTRPPHLRANDPDGRQGVWKPFEHQHDEGVKLYCATVPKGGRDVPYGPKVKAPPESKVVWYLADATVLRCRDFNGRSFELHPDKKTCLWSTPDTRTLLLLPKNLRKVQESDIFFVRGGRMRVTPMGIEY